MSAVFPLCVPSRDGAEDGVAYEEGCSIYPLGLVSAIMLQQSPLWVWLEDTLCFCKEHENMGLLEQVLRNAESPPEHKAAVQYFLRVFIIYESF